MVETNVELLSPSEPAAYPGSWEFDGLLTDGEAVLVRPVRPSDAIALAGLHVHAVGTSPTHIIGTHPSLVASELSHRATVDYRNRMGFVVIAGERVIAFASFDRVDEAESVAQVVFVVDETFQNRGIATLLFESLAAYAHAMGIGHFVADVLEENTHMLAILTSTGLRTSNDVHDGTVRISIDLRPTAKYRELCDEREAVAEVASTTAILRRARSRSSARGVRVGARVTRWCARFSRATTRGPCTRSIPRRVRSAASRLTRPSR